MSALLVAIEAFRWMRPSASEVEDDSSTLLLDSLSDFVFGSHILVNERLS